MYYYGESKNWSMSEVNVVSEVEVATIKRNKFSFGTGYAYKPFSNIGFDAHIGIFAALERRAEITDLSSLLFFRNGFDLGIGAYYNF
jgi:hypothetical protein